MTTKRTIDFPDGKGGYKPVEAEEVPGQQQDEDKASRAFDRAVKDSTWIRVSRAAEAFNKMHRAYQAEEQLTVEEFTAAVYLEILNMRTFFPENLGGSAYHDKICKLTWEYFERKRKEMEE